jgi:tripartite-type tricarboxylate transporter receptor subunit TctC
VLCDQTTNAVPQIQGNTIKAYAVTSPNRLSVLPDLPTLIEAGVPNFEFVIWHGLYAPKGTPADVVATLNGALQSALAEKMIQERFGAVGTEIFGPAERSPEPHRTRFGREVEQWKIVIGKSGVSN